MSVDEVHAHVHGAGRSRLDLIFALSAIFISAVSLFVAIGVSNGGVGPAPEHRFDPLGP